MHTTLIQNKKKRKKETCWSHKNYGSPAFVFFFFPLPIMLSTQTGKGMDLRPSLEQSIRMERRLSFHASILSLSLGKSCGTSQESRRRMIPAMSRAAPSYTHDIYRGLKSLVFLSVSYSLFPFHDGLEMARFTFPRDNKGLFFFFFPLMVVIYI